MAEATVNIQAVSVPVDDGEIARALTDVDAKLAVWAEAMLDAQRLLTEFAARVLAPAPSEPEETLTEPETAAPATEPVVNVTAEAEVVPGPLPTAEPEAVAAIEAEATVEETGAVAIEPRQPENRLTAPEVAKSTVTPVKFTGKMNVEAKPPPAPAPPPNEDERLLASLDPETAKAIKVMRRLAPGKKSVKELLAEYEATKVKTDTPKPEKKSWFSRGR